MYNDRAVSLVEQNPNDQSKGWVQLPHEPCHFCKSKVNRRDKIDDQVKQSYRARCYSHPEGPVSKYSRTKPTIDITKKKIGGPNHLCIRQMRLWKSHASALVPAARSSCWLRPGKRAPLSGAAKIRYLQSRCRAGPNQGRPGCGNPAYNCVSALGQTLNASQPGCEFSWLTVCRDGTLVLFSKRDRCGILNTHRREVAPSRDPPEPVALAAGVRPDCARGRETGP